MSRPWAPLLATALVVAGCSTLVRIEGTELVYRQVTPEVAFEMLRDSPDALVVDLRPRAEAAQSAAGRQRVRNLPLQELAERAAELAAFRNQTFLVYCGGDPGCGEQGMRILAEHGCAYAVLIAGELASWALDGSAAPGAAEAAAAEPPPPEL